MSEKKYSIFASRLKKSMEDKKFKQIDLVKRTGISKSSISQYLSGNFQPKNENLKLLSNVLGVDPLWLIGFDETDFIDSEESMKELNLRYSLFKKIYFKLDTLDSDALKFIDSYIDFLNYENQHIYHNIRCLYIPEKKDIDEYTSKTKDELCKSEDFI